MTKFFLLALSGLILALWPLASAHADKPPIMKVEEVKAGMKGYGLSVFCGTKPVRFNVEVLGVLWNFAPKRNVILVRCSEDPAVDYNGDGKPNGENDKPITKGRVSAGMSGSPVYIPKEDGKDYLIGAVALSWQFGVEPIAGVTPIEQMIADMETPLENAYATPGSVRLPEKDAKDAKDNPLAEYRNKLTYLATPLMVSGFNERVFNDFAKELRQYNIEAVQGGGAGKAVANEKVALEPGSTVGVPLVRGNMEIYAFGTLTMIDDKDKKWVGFGHPFVAAGECRLPLTVGSITTTMTGLASSFKFGGSLGQVGTLMRDRSSSVSGILTDEKDSVRMIPLTIKTAVKKNREAGKTEYKTYKLEMADFEAMLPNIVYYCASSVMADDLAAMSDVTSYIQMKFKFEGFDEVTTWDAYADAMGTQFSKNMAGLLAAIIFNPFGHVKLEYVDITIDITRELKAATIENVTTDVERVKPGQEITLKLKLKAYQKGEWWEEMKVKIPEDMKGDSVDLIVEGGNSAGYTIFKSLKGVNSVKDLLAGIKELFKPQAFVVTIPYDTVGMRYKGQFFKGLPPSVLRQFEAVAGRDATQWPDVAHAIQESEWIVSGQKIIHLIIDRQEK